MKIKVDLKTGEINCEREPMPKGRFKAICCVLCVVLYIVLISVAGAMLGFDGAIIASFFGLIGCGGAVGAIWSIEGKE